jgi:uncharacterized protein YcbK (DUF882 family)
MAIASAWRGAIVALAVATCAVFAGASQAEAETRTLKLYFIHTKERAEITFKKNGRYVQSGLNEINRFLRDWRRNEPAKMDPRLLDLVWEVYRGVGARDYIHVVSAYRSPATNKALRSRSSGVAEKSQHMLGKAMDFYIPGVSLSKLRQTAFKAQVGGVGYYPKSGSPFVHLDVGNVRSWPRMSRSELLALFPDGKTIHIPTDGKPLPGFNQALAEYKSGRKRGGSAIAVASADEPSEKQQGFFARLFGAGGGADAEEDNNDDGSVQVAAAPPPRRAEPAAPVVAAAAPRAAVAAAAPAGALPGVNGPLAPMAGGPAPAVAAPAEPEPETPETILARLPARSIPVPVWAARPSADVGTAVAEAAPVAAGEANALALAESLMGASAPAAADEEVQLALNAPRPTLRPDFALAAAPATEPAVEAERPIAVASAPVAAATATTAADIIAGVAGQPAAAEAAPSATLAAFLPLPSGRPTDDVVLASLPRSAATRAQAQDKVDERLARLAAAPGASPRQAVLARREGVAAESAVASGVRTTGKGSKPIAADSRPDPRAIPIPVPQQVARWALSNSEIRMDPKGATPPSFAHALVRSAPAVVYTEGFNAADVQASANRFTGKAVSFLSVARFGTN